MIASSIDGWEVHLVLAGDHLDPDGPPVARLDEVTADHPRLRRAVVTFPMERRPPMRHHGLLHWDDGTDLADLDRRARDGEDVHLDLERALFCDLRWARCLRCGRDHHLVTFDAGLPIVTAQRQRTHALERTCPSCGHDRFVPYAEQLPDT